MSAVLYCSSNRVTLFNFTFYYGVCLVPLERSASVNHYVNLNELISSYFYVKKKKLLFTHKINGYMFNI